MLQQLTSKNRDITLLVYDVIYFSSSVFTFSILLTLHALNNPHITSKLIDDTIFQLNLLGQQVRSLTIHWIEAHKGHAGNEKADEMARAAEFWTITDRSIDAPTGYDKQKLWAACYKQWATEWQQLTTCRMTKIFLSHTRQKQIKTSSTPWQSISA